jgi:nucleoid-associated protein YgaU
MYTVAPKMRLRIYSRARFTAFVVVVLAILFFIASTVFASVSNAMQEPVYETVIVKSGDTVWDIAKDCGDNKQDVRQVIQTIYKLNGMDSPKIYPGQILRIPETETVSS